MDYCHYEASLRRMAGADFLAALKAVIVLATRHDNDRMPIIDDSFFDDEGPSTPAWDSAF